MEIISLMCKNIYVVALFVGLVCIIYQDNFKSVFESLYTNYFHSDTGTGSNQRAGVFSPQQLALYNGVDRKELYLAILGNIYDVTKGSKHYAKGAPYHYFVGKDGSQAFITGNFKDESDEKDHVLDLSCNELFNILKWEDTLRKKYNWVGFLIGKYYNEDGKLTGYNIQLGIEIEKCKIEKNTKENENKKYPPCNIEWSVDSGTRVWCTNTSGGITRGWAGVPRQLYTPGEEKPRCVCVNLYKTYTAVLKKYENCDKTAESCTFK